MELEGLNEGVEELKIKQIIISKDTYLLQVADAKITNNEATHLYFDYSL